MKANLYDVYDKDNYGDTSAHNGHLYSRLVIDSMDRREKHKVSWKGEEKEKSKERPSKYLSGKKIWAKDTYVHV